MKTKNLLLFICLVFILTGCNNCCSTQKKTVCIFKAMKIKRSEITSLLVCDPCNDTTDSCFKRLTFQFTDSITNQNKMEFYITGWKVYRHLNNIGNAPIPLETDEKIKDTLIEPPFTLANIDWRKADIRDFLEKIPSNKNCKDSSYSYITFTVYVDSSNLKRYLSLIATAYDKNGNKIFSAPISSKTPNPRPPYPPEG